MMFVQFRNTYKILSHKYVIYFYEQNLYHILYTTATAEYIMNIRIITIVTCKVVMIFVCIKHVYKIILSVH